jgi:hypothetical protein
MHAPQVIIIALLSIEAISGAAINGTPKRAPKEGETVNGLIYVVRSVIWAALLWWGGFFS